MNSSHRISATVEAGVLATPKLSGGGSPVDQSMSHPTRLPLQKGALAVRDAKLSDAPALASLRYELGYETTTSEMRQRLKSILRDAHYRTFVAEIDGQVCGMIGMLTHASHEHNDFTGRITALVVSKKQRRSGVGRALIAAAEKDFAKRKVTRVSLNNSIHPRTGPQIL